MPRVYFRCAIGIFNRKHFVVEMKAAYIVSGSRECVGNNRGYLLFGEVGVHRHIVAEKFYGRSKALFKYYALSGRPRKAVFACGGVEKK